MLGNMADLFGKVQEMQQKMSEMKEKLAQTEYTSESGGGMVKVTVNGLKKVLSVKIDKDLIDPNDPEMLEDLIVAGVNKALDEVEKQAQNSMGDLTKGMMPGGFDLSKFGL
ncbi:YbaB/EbfC family nucleoid-associated protein [bacterium]|nr:MAG: YbaB/EbfC family nucleoid-associated protein [bacterium]